MSKICMAGVNENEKPFSERRLRERFPEIPDSVIGKILRQVSCKFCIISTFPLNTNDAYTMKWYLYIFWLYFLVLQRKISRRIVMFLCNVLFKFKAHFSPSSSLLKTIFADLRRFRLFTFTVVASSNIYLTSQIVNSTFLACISSKPLNHENEFWKFPSALCNGTCIFFTTYYFDLGNCLGSIHKRWFF